MNHPDMLRQMIVRVTRDSKAREFFCRCGVSTGLGALAPESALEPFLDEHWPCYPERSGGSISTFTGVQFWPLDPRPEEIFIEDIAHSLAAMNRFSGHTRVPFSVGDHSVLMSYRVPPEDALWATLHDSSEAFLVDVPKPLKPHLVGYQAAEERLMRAVCKRFNLPLEMPASVKLADKRMAVTEQRDLMPHRDWWSPPADIEPYPDTIVPRSHAQVKQAFLDRFNELSAGAL